MVVAGAAVVLLGVAVIVGVAIVLVGVVVVIVGGGAVTAVVATVRVQVIVVGQVLRPFRCRCLLVSRLLVLFFLSRSSDVDSCCCPVCGKNIMRTVKSWLRRLVFSRGLRCRSRATFPSPTRFIAHPETTIARVLGA